MFRCSLGLGSSAFPDLGAVLRVATGGPISDKTTRVGPGIAMWSTAALWLVFIVIVGIQEDRLE